MLARARGIVFENSPDTARVRGEAWRVWFFGTVRPGFGEAGDSDPGLRRSLEGTERSLGLRRSPPERLSRDGFARSGTFRVAGAAAGVEEALVAPGADEKTGRRDVGRGRPLRRGIWRRSSISARRGSHCCGGMKEGMRSRKKRRDESSNLLEKSAKLCLRCHASGCYCTDGEAILRKRVIRRTAGGPSWRVAIAEVQ